MVNTIEILDKNGVLWNDVISYMQICQGPMWYTAVCQTCLAVTFLHDSIGVGQQILGWLQRDPAIPTKDTVKFILDFFLMKKSDYLNGLDSMSGSLTYLN